MLQVITKTGKKPGAVPPPKREYDVILIGGGGHGLGAAYYLARDHGITNVAVLEKSWVGGGNTARNTMTIRDNYIRSASVPFHRESMKLWRGLSRELNYNVMLHERGMIKFLQSGSGISHAQRIELFRTPTNSIYGCPKFTSRL